MGRVQYGVSAKGTRKRPVVSSRKGRSGSGGIKAYGSARGFMTKNTSLNEYHAYTKAPRIPRGLFSIFTKKVS